MVLLLQEPLDLVEAVPVDGLHVLRREPHGDDALVDVREVCRGSVHESSLADFESDLDGALISV